MGPQQYQKCQYHFLLGLLHLRTGDGTGAQRELRQALQIWNEESSVAAEASTATASAATGASGGSPTGSGAAADGSSSSSSAVAGAGANAGSALSSSALALAIARSGSIAVSDAKGARKSNVAPQYFKDVTSKLK